MASSHGEVGTGSCRHVASDVNWEKAKVQRLCDSEYRITHILLQTPLVVMRHLIMRTWSILGGRRTMLSTDISFDELSILSARNIFS